MFCQVTKERLDRVEDAYFCKSLKLNYPVKSGITFMGYDQKEKIAMLEILMDSQKHQGNETTLKNDFEFAKYSYPLIAISLSVFKKLYPDNLKAGRVAVNVGSGGDPSSSEIAALGFDTYACEIEPNSLYMSSFWDNKISPIVKRIACNCFSLPFPDQSVDLIYCKEFLHHMQDYDGMINEFSRVLRKDGIAIVIEPTLTHRTTKGAIEFPGHHYQTNSKYSSSFRNNGFLIDEYYLHYIIRTTNFKHKISKIPFSYFNKQLKNAKHTIPALKTIIQRIADGQNIWFLRKKQSVRSKETNKIEKLEIISTDFLTIDDSIFDNEYFGEAALFYDNVRQQYDFS